MQEIKTVKQKGNILPSWLISQPDLWFFVTYPTIEILDAIRADTNCSFPKRQFARMSIGDLPVYLFQEMFAWEIEREAEIQLHFKKRGIQ